jgi:hypothetical protein
MRLSLEEFLAQKADYSDHFVHLTRRRDQTPAWQVLGEILISRRIEARGIHCLAKKKVASLPLMTQERFKVACLSECPPEVVSTMCKPVQGRSYQVEPFGLYFRRKFIEAAGAIPVLYAGYPAHMALQDLWGVIEASGKQDLLWKLMPYVSQVTETFDFSWEREWRIAGPLAFQPSDLTCVFCRAAEMQDLERFMYDKGVDWDEWRPIPFFDPETMELVE